MFLDVGVVKPLRELENTIRFKLFIRRHRDREREREWKSMISGLEGLHFRRKRTRFHLLLFFF